MNAKLAKRLANSNFRIIENIAAKYAISRIDNSLIKRAVETVRQYANKGFYGCSFYHSLCDEYLEELRGLGYDVYYFPHEVFIYWGNGMDIKQ